MTEEYKYKCPKCGMIVPESKAIVSTIREDDGTYDGEYIDCPNCDADLRGHPWKCDTPLPEEKTIKLDKVSVTTIPVCVGKPATNVRCVICDKQFTDGDTGFQTAYGHPVCDGECSKRYWCIIAGVLTAERTHVRRRDYDMTVLIENCEKLMKGEK